MEIEKIKKLWIHNTIEETQPGEHYRYMKPDEFMNKLNYEVGFVAEQHMIGIEGLTSMHLKERVKQFLFNEKEKQKQNVINLINERNALQNEVNKLKEIF